MNAFTYFGGQLFLNFTPPSKHYLSPNNYKIYYKSDLQNDFDFKLGTSVTRKEFIEFKPNMKTFTIKINWVDPITSTETTVFPEKTFEIKQAAPTISTKFAYESVIGTDLILCRLANVKISSFTYRKLYADDIVLDAQIESSEFNQDYKIVGKPIINFDGKNITVTDPNMTRFMMTLDHAVELVLFAFNNGESGDIFVQKSPASTIGDLAVAMKEIYKSDVAIENIGIRHAEKMHETLLSVEERLVSQDLGDYYRVPADNRDLNYNKYFSEGIDSKSVLEEYNSFNTNRLSIGELKDLLRTIGYK